jgi:EAL domain-containing protein (putative c-di-GMP-specific phosphodiesterase class I)
MVYSEASSAWNAWPHRSGDALSEHPPLTMCVNRFGRQLHRPNSCAAKLKRCACRSGVMFDPSPFEKEITESLLMENMEWHAEVVKLKEMGCCNFRMDDLAPVTRR